MFLREITASVHVLRRGLYAHRALQCAAAAGAAMCAPPHYVTGYLRRAVPVSSVWLCAHLVWLRGQGVAACGRMCGGRRKGNLPYGDIGYGDIGPYYGISCPECGKSCSRQAVSKSVNIKNRSNLGICCLGNCVRCGFHKFMENGFAGGITAGREAACGRNHRSIFGVQQACHIKYGGAAVARPCYDFYCLITACP